MVDKIRQYIEKNGLLRRSDSVIAAVSGGADSLCLLEILYRLGMPLTAVHVQHHLRESAENDARFTEEFCRERGIPFIRKDVDVRERRAKTGESEEEAARALRYEALEAVQRELEEKNGRTVIALAHHKNDQAETVLFHLIRGSGIKGLSGIPLKRDRYIRPMLAVTREEIVSWMKAEGLPYCTDETNYMLESTRNIIRHTVIPALEAVRNDAVEKISEAAAELGETETFLDLLADRWLKDRDIYALDGRIELPETIEKEDPVLQRYLIRNAIRQLKCGLKDYGRKHIEDIVLLSGKQVGKTVDLPGKLIATRTYRGILISASSPVSAHDRIPAWQLNIRTFLYEKNQKIPEKEYTKWFDYDKIIGEISLRFRKPGDLFSTKAGTHKKLKDWMIDEKIPKALRDRLLLVADDSEVLWVPGYRMSESKKVTEKTKTVIEITVKREAAYDG